MRKKLRLIFLGIVGRTPFAGVDWQTLHYLEGFRRLGHEVYYVEDTRSWPFDPEKNCVTNDSRYAVNHIARLMDWCGMQDRWAYRAVEQNDRVFGLSGSQLARAFEGADLLVNLTGSTRMHDEYLNVPVRVYLETDPVVPQIRVAQGDPVWIDLLNAHTHHFTYSANLGRADCSVPVGSFRYQPTRPPVVLEWWSSNKQSSASNGCRFTTIGNWRQSGNDIVWNGETYTWSKHHEFLKFIELPRRTKQPLELALSQVDSESMKLLQSHGWRVVNSLALSKNILPYRDYVLGSRGEFTVAKDQNVRLRSGWFSDRSVCYLAAGRPVITQDTGLNSVFPTGEGLFAFHTTDEIIEGLGAIAADYEKHSHAARKLAAEYFQAETVLHRLLKHIGN